MSSLQAVGSRVFATDRFWPLLVLPTVYAAVSSASGVPLEPDATYYTSGFALFPSPIGTLIGEFGYPGLTVANGCAIFAIILLVGAISRELGGVPLLAQALAIALAPDGWFRDVGMDAPAIALLLGALLLHLRHRSGLSLALVVLAALTHLAALPLTLGAMLAYRASVRVLAIVTTLFGLGLVFALTTGYRAGLAVVRQPSAFVEGASEVIHACWPLLILLPFATFAPGMGRLVMGSMLGAIVAGAVPASVGQVGIVRYAAPCVLLAVATMLLRERFRFRVREPAAAQAARGHVSIESSPS